MRRHAKTAMILSAGLGTRMRPLTDDTPKPLVPLAGKALIDHVLDRLRDAGVEKAVVNAHYHAQKLEEHLAGRYEPRIIMSDERRELLDTGGGVVKALNWLGKEPFLIHNSDSVWIESQDAALGGDTNLDRLINTWDEERMDTLLLLAPCETSIGYGGAGDFDMTARGKLIRRVAGATAPFVFAGVSIAHPRLFDSAPKGRFSLNLLWSNAIAAGRAFGIRAEGIWMHVGDPRALELAERQLRGGRKT